MTDDKGPFADLPADVVRAITRYGTPPVRQEVTVRVRDISSYSYDDLPDTPEDMIEWLKEAIAEAPAEYRDSLGFKLDYESGSYGDGDTSSLTIWYNRPETDDEMRERVGFGLAYLRDAEKTERQHYNALKKKYG